MGVSHAKRVGRMVEASPRWGPPAAQSLRRGLAPTAHATTMTSASALAQEEEELSGAMSAEIVRFRVSTAAGGRMHMQGLGEIGEPWAGRTSVTRS